jgi:hypothetical protein
VSTRSTALNRDVLAASLLKVLGKANKRVAYLAAQTQRADREGADDLYRAYSSAFSEAVSSACELHETLRSHGLVAGGYRAPEPDLKG